MPDRAPVARHERVFRVAHAPTLTEMGAETGGSPGIPGFGVGVTPISSYLELGIHRGPADAWRVERIFFQLSKRLGEQIV